MFHSSSVVQFGVYYCVDCQMAVLATTLQPTNDAESAILATLAPGNYTAIVRGAGNGTGVALVEVYGLL
jgi:hypothetical protein